MSVNDGANDSQPDVTEVHLQPRPEPITITQPPLKGDYLDNGTFVGELHGKPEHPFQVQASTNLVYWVNIDTTYSDFYSVMSYTEDEIVEFPHRLYRPSACECSPTEQGAIGWYQIPKCPTSR